MSSTLSGSPRRIRPSADPRKVEEERTMLRTIALETLDAQWKARPARCTHSARDVLGQLARPDMSSACSHELHSAVVLAGYAFCLARVPQVLTPQTDATAKMSVSQELLAYIPPAPGSESVSFGYQKSEFGAIPCHCFLPSLPPHASSLAGSRRRARFMMFCPLSQVRTWRRLLCSKSTSSPPLTESAVPHSACYNCGRCDGRGCGAGGCGRDMPPEVLRH